MTSLKPATALLATALIALTFLNCGCGSLSTAIHKTQYEDLNALLHANDLQGKNNTYLKAHMKNGGVLLFTNDWTIDSTRNVVIGEAQWFNKRRRRTAMGATEVHADDVILFETNDKKNPRKN